MEFYYHVYEIKKEKGCRFKFYYYKNSAAICIHGDVGVELDSNLGKIASFDPTTDLCLSNREKTGIVNTVLKYIYL